MTWSKVVLGIAAAALYLVMWWWAIAGLLSDPVAPAGVMAMCLITGMVIGAAAADVGA